MPTTLLDEPRTIDDVSDEFARLLATTLAQPLAELSLSFTAPQFRARPRNEALLQQALDHITDHPETHNQTVWCEITSTGGLRGCLAFHALRLAGATLEWKPGDCVCGDPDCQAGIEAALDGERISIEDGARIELGLSHGEATALFNPLASTAEMWRIAGQLTDGRVARKAV